MNTPHLDHIETAFLQLSFAIKLCNYLDIHSIDKEKFDIALTIKDESNCVCLLENEFETSGVSKEKFKSMLELNLGKIQKYMEIPDGMHTRLVSGGDTTSMEIAVLYDMDRGYEVAGVNSGKTF